MPKLDRLIASSQWVILLLLLPLFIFPTGIRMLVLLVVPLFWIVSRLLRGRFFTRSPYDLAILILLSMTVVSLLVTFDLNLSLPKIAGLVLGIALFYATLDFCRVQSLWPVVGAYLAIGFLISVIGLLGTVWPSPFDFLNRVRSLLSITQFNIPGTVGGVINENELAGVLNWIAPLALACLIGQIRPLWAYRKFGGILLVVVVVSTSLTLIATSSRGGILAYGVAATVVLAFFVPSRWRIVLSIWLVICVLVIFSFSINPVKFDFVGDTLGLPGRLEIWSRAILAIGDFPITGMGLNSFRRVVQVLYPSFIIPAEIDLAHSHNHLLQVALDVGIPGLISYLAMWIVSIGLIWSSVKKIAKRDTKHKPEFALIAGLTGSLTGGWLFGIFDAIALGSRPAFLWWLLLGMLGSVHYKVVFAQAGVRSHKQAGDAAEEPAEGTILPVPIPTDRSRYSNPSRYTK